jgi:hypothetical protein
MKQAIKLIAGAALVALVSWLVRTFGMIFEFEYPYVLTLMSVGGATSVTGMSATEIIRANGEKWGPRLHWHTCSYCAGSCGDHKNLICVQLEAPNERTRYYFAYRRDDHTLVPMTSGTATQFPKLMPVDDRVENICQLNGQPGMMSIGYGNLELPVKWFRAATRADPGSPANRSQPVHQATNRTSAVGSKTRFPPHPRPLPQAWGEGGE